jgi:hypothetical protein
MIRRTASALLLAAGLGAGSAFAAVESTPVVLGDDGTTYRLWAGSFGEIFGANSALPADRPILALDVVPPGQALSRLLVPGSEGGEVESSAVLVHDAASDAVHLIWNQRTSGNQVHSQLALRSFGAAGWSAAVEIAGGTLTEKRNLRAAVAHDDYATRLGDADVRVTRRTVHLVWSESSGGETRSYYTPVAFVGGRYLGWNPVVALDDVAVGEAASAVAAPEALRDSPALSLSASGRAVVSFVHSATQRLVTAEIRALPGELGELAEMARGHIVELIGAHAGGDRTALAEMARGHIVELAGRFHDSAKGYLGERAASLILETPAEVEASVLGEMARGHIVELGRAVVDAGLVDDCAGQGFVVGVPPLDPAPGAAFEHLFSLRRIASWSFPAEIGPSPQLFVSPGGTRALLAWESAGQVAYRASLEEGGWTEVRTLDLALMTSAEAWSAVARLVAGN